MTNTLMAHAPATRLLERWRRTHSFRRNTLDVPIPEGWPTEKGEMLIECWGTDEECKRIINSFWWPGSGYSVHVTTEDLMAKPARRLSPEKKGAIRRKALTRRIEAQAPLFAPTIIESELISNRSYFHPEEAVSE